jgi:hypothetical protein
MSILYRGDAAALAYAAPEASGSRLPFGLPGRYLTDGRETLRGAMARNPYLRL